MRAAFILALLVTILQVVLCCEDETHYTNADGKCCKKCGPGKRMLVDDNCDDPHCKECEIGEYQSGYTVETKCQRQPSCDTNLNFKPEKNPSKTIRIKCECESGYYCTMADDCNSCRKHTICVPGQKVVKQGSSMSDTICMSCENGTFSNKTSANSCNKWTECKHGLATPGSSTSDTTCVLAGPPNFRIVVIALVLAVVLVLVLAGLLVILQKRGKFGCYQYHKHTLTDVKTNEDVAIAVEPFIQQPQEEDEDDIGPVSPTPSNRTENGNVVEQEYGKEPFYPSHESNPHAQSVL